MHVPQHDGRPGEGRGGGRLVGRRRGGLRLGGGAGVAARRERRAGVLNANDEHAQADEERRYCRGDLGSLCKHMFGAQERVLKYVLGWSPRVPKVDPPPRRVSAH